MNFAFKNRFDYTKTLYILLHITVKQASCYRYLLRILTNAEKNSGLFNPISAKI